VEVLGWREVFKERALGIWGCGGVGKERGREARVNGL